VTSSQSWYRVQLQTSVNRQVLALFIAPALLVLVIGILSFRATISYEDASNQVERSHTAEANLARVFDDLQDAETAQRGYLLTGEDSYLQPYEKATAQVAPNLQLLGRSIESDPAQQQRFQLLEQQISLRLSALEDDIRMSQAQGPDAARRQIETDVGKDDMDAVRTTVGQIRDEEQTQFDQRSADRDATAHNQLIALATLIGLELALLLASFLIARRYLAERRARERQTTALAEARYRAVGDVVPFGVWSTGADGRLTYMSKSFLDFVGMTLDEFRRDGWRRILGEKALEEMQESWDAAVQLRQPFEYLRTITGADGSKRDILGKSIPILGLGGEVVGYAGINLDVTEQQHAADALRQSERRYRTLMEALPAMIATSDPDGVVLYHNSKWADYTGLSNDELRNDGWRAIMHPHDLPNLQATFQEAQTPPRQFGFDYRLRRSDGEYRWHHDVTTPVFDEQGNLSLWISVDLDIDAQKRHEQELQQANAAKDDFLGMVSHELRTPLTVILGNAQALRRVASLSPEDLAGCIVEIQRESSRLHRLIENMLTVSRIERGQVQDLEPVLLQRALPHMIAAHAESTPIAIDVEEGLEAVAANPNYLEQIMQNLISNAIKYSPPGSPIDIRARSRDGCAEVSVLDRGSGIAPEEIERIFEPFFRSSSTATQAAGIGLGLSVCKRLVDAQGGELWARPREGGGTEIGFSLPLYPEDRASRTLAVAARNR
jgi:PAS domain S-box-containing protein